MISKGFLPNELLQFEGLARWKDGCVIHSEIVAARRDEGHLGQGYEADERQELL